MNRRTLTLGLTLAVLVIGVAACSKEQPGPPTSQIEENEQVNRQTHEVVQAPRLRGTLELRNETTDQTARLISGSLEFLDRDGHPIPVASDREAPRFTFYAYRGDRLDPGMETSHDVDVSFPAAARDGTRLADLRVNITYIPDPYRAETATVPVSLAAGQ